MKEEENIQKHLNTIANLFKHIEEDNIEDALMGTKQAYLEKYAIKKDRYILNVKVICPDCGGEGKTESQAKKGEFIKCEKCKGEGGFSNYTLRQEYEWFGKLLYVNLKYLVYEDPMAYDLEIREIRDYSLAGVVPGYWDDFDEDVREEDLNPRE